ncbi:TonB-dependent siderophore receptor [Salinimonas sp. HHU 13199]|uniref:TonB-dependent siderophore receptor n=1 Tax=Salinimonas profundi TaxID=2729140 RepID=A0ABR8LHQ9_9ALTE|nr:TonB-dependent siderophore receptor [Salinimonas profundi]MBD3585783.1 TonB-dependent siderophore receptor [Salinimonas profundi]
MLFNPPLKLILTVSLIIGATPFSFASDTSDIEHVRVTSVRLPFRADVPLKSQPQAVDTVLSEQLENLAITDFSSALTLAASVSKQNNFGGMWNAFAIRGFTGDENVPSGYLVNGFNAGRGFGGTRDMTNVERIEVLKGPGSALYGRSEPGGTINIITKKPQFDRAGYLQASVGRWDQYRLEGDYTSALSDNVAVRMNGAYEDNGSFRVPVDSKKIALTPSLLWLVNAKTRLRYEAEYLDQQVPFDRGIVALEGNPELLPAERFLGEPSDGPNQVDVLGHQLTLEHDLNDWSLLAGLSYRDTQLTGFSSDAELVKGRQQLFTDGETLSRQHSYRNFDTSDFSGRLELSGSVDTGIITHHLLIGADYYHFNFDKYWTRYRPAAGTTDYAINIFNPVYGQQAPARSLLYDQSEKQENYGFYVQNQIDLSQRVKLQVGGRFDDFKQTIENHKAQTVVNQQQSVFSPRAGIVYLWDEAVSLYASYSEGFQPNTGANAQGNAFVPEESESFEVGSKFESAMFEGTVALFRAEKSNILTADPLNSGFSAALGKADSQGVEIDLKAYFTENIRTSLSYAYTDAKTANQITNADWGVNIPKGSRLINIPKHNATLSLIHDTVLMGKSTSWGGNVQYVGKRLGETIDPSYILPDYTLVNVFSRFEITADTTLQLNVTNLFDEKYYPSSYSAIWTMPGEPRSYRVSVNYRF